MRIAHLDTGRSWRGGQAQIRLLMRGLRRRGHESLLLAPRGPLLERAAAEGFAVRRWRPLGEWDLGAALAAAGALRAFRAEVMHAHSAHAHALGVPAARLAGARAAVVSRRVDFSVGGHPLSALKYRLPVDRYLCISRGVRDVLRAAGIPERRLALVPSGIELPRPQDCATGTRLHELIGAPPEAPIVGTVAALAPHKNHADLMRAAAVVTRERPAVHFVWLGEGECRPALERQRAELGLLDRVHMPGFREDAKGLLLQCTLFALGSYLEGLCTSILDAQALGIPVVATRTGGIPDAVEDGVTGRLVPARDPEAMARALIEALDDPSARAAWAAHARITVRAFEAEHMVERTLAVYEEVLAGRVVPGAVGEAR